jgi:Tfp pilus assembly protein PilX
MRPHSQDCRFLIKFILYLRSGQSESGFAMMVVSILSILLFSLLAAYLVLSNISKATTTAFVDSSSSFYAAESGLNRRAEDIRKQFLGFAQPTGTSPADIGNCINNSGGTGSDDFACINYTFNYSEPSVTKAGNSLIESRQQKSPYIAYTYVQPNPKNLPTTQASMPSRPVRI